MIPKEADGVELVVGALSLLVFSWGNLFLGFRCIPDSLTARSTPGPLDMLSSSSVLM